MIQFCKGIPGGISAHKVSDPEDLVCGLCPDCQTALTGAKSWSTSQPNLGKSTGKGSPIVINVKKHTPKSHPKFRNYPEKRKQPWGMERK